MIRLLSILLLLIPVTAFSQLVADSLLIEGKYRTFAYYRPVTDIKEGSLLFLMHGSGGSGSDMLNHTRRLEAAASTEKLLIVYPNGYKRYWNECRKFSNAAANLENVNEQAFFTAMIQYFTGRFGVSHNKVFAAGFSGGGQMAYKLGITMPGVIRGIAAVVANMPVPASCDCEYSGKPLPVLIINGTQDKVNPYNGGEMFVNNASFGVVMSSRKSFNYWASMANYVGVPQKEKLADSDTSDHKMIEAYHFREAKKPPVTLLKVIGGRHDYPADIDVYTYCWNFFKTAVNIN